MKWLQSQMKKQEEAIDDHDQPTEPIERIVLPAYRPSAPQEEPFPVARTMPASPAPQLTVAALPQPDVVPTVPAIPPPPPPYSLPQPGTENPVLPPSPAQQQGQPPSKGANAGVIEEPRRKHTPILVGYLFVCVQLLLLVRFIMNFVALASDNVWRDIVYTISDVFLLPFQLIFLHVAIANGVAVPLYTLLAVLIYGIVSRTVVHLLKHFL